MLLQRTVVRIGFALDTWYQEKHVSHVVNALRQIADDIEVTVPLETPLRGVTLDNDVGEIILRIDPSGDE